MKLFQAHSVSSIAVKDERAFSAYLTGPKTYNTIDEDHKHESRVEEVTDESAEGEDSLTPREVEVKIETDV